MRAGATYKTLTAISTEVDVFLAAVYSPELFMILELRENLIFCIDFKACIGFLFYSFISNQFLTFQPQPLPALEI